MILLIDNYDSFSYNLYQLVGSIAGENRDAEEVSADPAIRVVRNDEIGLADIVVMRPSHIIISPGPGRPADAGICEKVIASFAGKIPILGVCLGHQAICEVYGAAITYAKNLTHGKASQIKLDGDCPLFDSLPGTISGARYHSLAADRATMPSCLLIRAETEDGEVMAVQHVDYPVYGLQFHPESILTPRGEVILGNFLNTGLFPTAAQGFGNGSTFSE
ncbi:MAG: aminodeoxychorismate/anthranilate synthase component II [Treponema sp.]|jgi:anthranilate synthase component 2|nr:aminodeoxychorismate/anthranilate synthase component II [Treponema sp.]